MRSERSTVEDDLVSAGRDIATTSSSCRDERCCC